MMDELNSTYDLVKNILNNNERSRNSDNYLFYLVAKNILARKGLDADVIGFKELFSSLNKYGIPPFETVTRSRRKVQQKHPELVGSRSVNIERAMKQEEFINF